MKVSVRPVGGLGNQLFIYAAGRALAAKYGGQLFVDSSGYTDSNPRDFELDSFASRFTERPADLRFGKTLRQALDHASSARQKIRQIIPNSQARRLNKAFIYKSPPTPTRETLRLRGYLQSWRYFDLISGSLREELRDISEPSDWFLETTARLAASPFSVGVHVRRGDYLSHPYMGIVPDSYYKSALSLIRDVQKDFTVYVFSDEPQEVQDSDFLEAWRKDVVFLAPPPESRPVETLNLMSSCDHLVMANSSLSWWGAWLGDRPSRYVIYPRPWLEGAYVDDRDLALPHWISMGA